jgi:ribosomal-protein-alanine N-acetyltransferase
MIATSLQVRPAAAADQRQIADLMYFEAHIHRHLDWRPPLDWLGSAHYWVIEEHSRLLAALACPQDPPGIAWVRLFVHSASLGGLEAWSALLDAARLEIAAAGGALLAAIALQPWFQDILQHSGFHVQQQIVLLEWTNQPSEARAQPLGVSLRPMRREDLPAVADVDADAFVPLWANTLDALQKAYAQAVYASVAEKDGRLIGYQLSTGTPFGGHLGRLAVRSEAQGRGIGEALIGGLLQYLRAHGLWRLTVNTQADNEPSLKLYQKLGFVRTGEVYPVFTFRVD